MPGWWVSHEVNTGLTKILNFLQVFYFIPLTKVTIGRPHMFRAAYNTKHIFSKIGRPESNFGNYCHRDGDHGVNGEFAAPLLSYGL